MLQEADIGIGISGAEGMQVSTINNQTQTKEQFVQDTSLYYAFFMPLDGCMIVLKEFGITSWKNHETEKFLYRYRIFRSFKQCL